MPVFLQVCLGSAVFYAEVRFEKKGGVIILERCVLYRVGSF